MITLVFHVITNQGTRLAASLALALMCVAAVNAAPIMPGSPDWAWALDDGPGATAATAEFGSVNGTIVSAVDTTETHFTYVGNRALSFDGDGDRVDMDGINISSGNNNAVTYSAWVYSLDTDSRAHIFGNWFQSPKDEVNTVLLYGKGSGGVGILTETTGGTQSVGWADLPEGEWVHLVAVWDGSPTNDGYGAIYVNGSLEASINTAGALRNITDEGVYGLGMDSGDDIRYFHGYVDEMAVWQSALTDDNIEWLYNNSMTTIPEPSGLALICLGAWVLLGYRRLRD